MPSFKTTTKLNLRSSPKIAPETLMATLLTGTLVTKLEDAQISGWWQVDVPSLSTIGFVFASYLSASTEEEGAPLPAPANIPQVDLTPRATTDSRRSSINARAYPLNELNMPVRIMSDASAKINSLQNIIAWLDVENSARYGPVEAHTYCNIYAYDFCRLAGVYLPRVWWMRSAIANLVLGTVVHPAYGTTVSELNANSLFDWFTEFGRSYGWSRVFLLDDLQKSASEEGKVAVIVGQRINLNTAGHITCVVPETPSIKAERNSSKNVIRPLQSQAGRFNHKYYVGNWWSDSAKFRGFGFWIHD